MPYYQKFKCIFCGQHMEYEHQFAGRQIKCPSCGHKITIPGGKPPGMNKQPQDQTWAKDIESPEVTTPTRYMETKKNKQAPTEE